MPTPTPDEPSVPPAPEPARLPGAAGLPTQVLLSTPGTEFRVGGGPYTVPVSITNASRVTTISLSLAYNAAVLRVRAVQEGSFMRQGGAAVAFSQQVDAAAGRVDLTLARTDDRTGASGAGLLAAILFEPVAAGTVTLSLSGVGTTAQGETIPLVFTPLTITVR